MVTSVRMVSSVLFGSMSSPHLLNSFILKKLEQFVALDTLIESYMDNLFAIVDANLNTEKLREAFVFNLSEETNRPMTVDHSAIIKQIIFDPLGSTPPV